MTLTLTVFCVVLFAACGVLILQNLSMRRQINTSHSKAEAHAVERSALLKEINHRVKNTLQLFQSLLNLEHRRVVDEGQTGQIFQVFGARLRTMALMFRDIYGQGEMTGLELDQLLEDVVLQSGILRPTDRVELQLEPAYVDLDTANALALIACEVLLVAGCEESNPSPTEICVRLRADANQVTITFEDRSRCLESIFNPDALSITIISDLAHQIEAELSISEDDSAGNRHFELVMQKAASTRTSLKN